MPTCGGLRIGVREQRAEDAAVGDGERAARESSSVSVPSSARFAKSRIAARSRRTTSVGVAQHRHDQAAARADGDADVVVVLQHHLVALDLGVEPRERSQRADARLHEERREAQARRRGASGTLPSAARAAPCTADMSTSLKVVSIAAVCCASTRRLAIVARRFDMRTRSSVRSPGFLARGGRAGGWGLGAGGFACGWRLEAGGWSLRAAGRSRASRPASRGA